MKTVRRSKLAIPRPPRRPPIAAPRKEVRPGPPRKHVRPGPPRSVHARPAAAVAHDEDEEKSILDLVDNLLNRGVVINGELVLGVAGVDLIYLRLSALLAAADRVLPRLSPPR